MLATSLSHRGRAAAGLAVTLACLFCFAACGDKKKSSPKEHNRTYKARGLVESLPGKDGSMFIRHEAIPGFVTSAGKKMDMQPMSMGFFSKLPADTQLKL
jgi:hypothetical protein